jgi:DNA-binding NarL/FixJ family response regulator
MTGEDPRERSGNGRAGDPGAGDAESSIRVLVVDADPRVRTALRNLLSVSPGFSVVGTARSAAAAVELARRHLPAVAIVGLPTPMTSGHRSRDDSLRMLSGITSELPIPVVAMSMRSGLRGPAFAAGARQFVDQDSTPETLLTAVRTAALGPDRDK